MILKYDFDIDNQAVLVNLRRLTNQTFKLLPIREEGADWEKPLVTILEELSGLDRLLIEDHESLCSLICKLEGLFSLTQENDFMTYRGVIFECLNLFSELSKICQD